jgi:hypothetical protein
MCDGRAAHAHLAGRPRIRKASGLHAPPTDAPPVPPRRGVELVLGRVHVRVRGRVDAEALTRVLDVLEARA